MGNCQAAEAATVVIEHPKGKAERVYWSIRAHQVMAANPGHYVAAVVAAAPASGSPPVRHLKLLRPDDTLHIGHVYRLVSFEEVLREFGSRKHVKLSRLLVEQEGRRSKRREGKAGGEERRGDPGREESSSTLMEAEQQQDESQTMGSSDTMGSSGGIAGVGSSCGVSKYGQWRPTLKSIAEAGS